MPYILISALVIRVITDICFKLAVRNVEFRSLKDGIGQFLRLLLHPAIVVAMVISVLNFWLWCMVLSHYDLSFAYPLFSICFAAIMVCGALFFDEHLDRYKSIGIGFILLSSVVLVMG
tara:strand:- start:652 stop:1005 length:354 start_codon:yes stop_codon:yes gene_type:complete